MNEPRVTWGVDGFASSSGWETVFCVMPITDEYQQTQDVWVSAGTGLPAGAYLDKPMQLEPGKAIVRKIEGWTLVDDYRGQTAYRKDNLSPQQITDPGGLPATLTLATPTSQFDRWNDVSKTWVKDIEAENAWVLEQATAQRNSLLAEANQQISVLTDAVDLGMATETEQAAYTAWRQYRVLLSRLDLTQQPIAWPPKPATAS